MLPWQIFIILFIALITLIAFIFAYHRVIIKKNPYAHTPFIFLGIFVWVDALIIAPFWFFTSLASLLFQNFILFLLLASLFWLVRSLGETIYWLMEQFSSPHRNLPQNLFGYFLVKNDSLYILYQLYWQIIFLLSLITLIHIIPIYLNS